MKKFLFAFVLSLTVWAQADSSLNRILELDRALSNDALLPAREHLYRAEVYSANRLFSEARRHWQKILDNYSDDETVMPKTLFGIARSYMWERDYEKAIFYFDRLIRDYLHTKEGREGVAFKGACYVRLSRHDEAASVYEQYIRMFPFGERIESSHLNLIDALREAKRYEEAEQWVETTVKRFSGMPAATNALHAKLRMEIYRGRWINAVATANNLLALNKFKDSMTSREEVLYLQALALEESGKRSEAMRIYRSISDSTSYFGELALRKLGFRNKRILKTVKSSSEYPAPYRNEILRYAKAKKLDPRFILAIMKQESSFRTDAKSPAGARGLLQLVYDTAVKYSQEAGFSKLEPDDLYSPEINIAISIVYIAKLFDEFDHFYEPVAASYNAGEDNAARWLNRTKPKDAGVFIAEIGFSETKNYVLKVMNNYRFYRELYDENLNPRER
ncbi:MAG: transglycosylase SLT domain-containing protein [Pyrinomonadaceae bacterium]|nr:transglycosylase SLT domain-containing protein [Pyrinomonadaceae bacterium]MCX7639545.1 transglycosylase SLT domain-containing protein [Pyrinomonadaceae bacterium]MDW8304404.1 transglycosylase SLT domain-containing protein [Acidobacteriota bacterium]